MTTTTAHDSRQDWPCPAAANSVETRESSDDINEHNRSESRPPNNVEPIQLGKDRLVYSVAEAGQLLGLSRAFAYELVARGELPIIRFGRRIVVPKAALLELLGSASQDG